MDPAGMSAQGWKANVDGPISCQEAWLDNISVSFQHLFQQINLLSLTLNAPEPEPLNLPLVSSLFLGLFIY